MLILMVLIGIGQTAELMDTVNICGVMFPFGTAQLLGESSQIGSRKPAPPCPCADLKEHQKWSPVGSYGKNPAFVQPGVG